MLMTSTDESPERPNISSTSAYESEVDISAMDSVTETEDEAETSLWIDEKELQHEKRETLNNAVAKLTEGPIASTLNTSWDDVSVTAKILPAQNEGGYSSSIICCCSWARRVHVELFARRKGNCRCK